jgi:hypothetical protein
LFLYSSDADFIEEPHKKNEKKPSQFANFVHHVHTNELEINDTTDTGRYASYIDMHLKIDSEIWLRRQLYNKRDYFNFLIVNFPLYIATFQPHLYMEYISLSVDTMFQIWWFLS